MSLTALLFLVVYFGCIIRSLAGKPIYGLFAYIQVIYMYAPGSWWGGSLPDLRWSLLAAIVTLISIFMHEKNIKNALAEPSRDDTPWYTGPGIKLLIIFVVWIWIQNLWSIGDRHFEYTILATKLLLLVFMINKTVKTIEDLVGVLIAHILGCAFFGYIGLSHSSGRFESAPTPGMSDGNLLSIHMAPILISAGYLLLLKTDKKRFLLIPFLVLTLNAIFLTQSRGVLVGILCAAIMSLLFIPKYQKKSFLFLGFIGVIGASFIVGDQLIKRVNETTNDVETGGKEKSAESRIYIAAAQFEMLKLRPMTGQGHKGTLFLSPQFMEEQWLTKQGVRASHNLTMSILVDHGIIGFIFYYGAIMAIFFKALSYRKAVIRTRHPVYILLVGCVLGLFAMLVSSQFANSVRLEIDIWMIALCSLLLKWIKNGKNLDWNKESNDVDLVNSGNKQ